MGVEGKRTGVSALVPYGNGSGSMSSEWGSVTVGA